MNDSLSFSSLRYKQSALAYILMNAFYYMSYALFSGLISIYLLDQGYHASQISIIIASSYILSVITQPIIGKLNDHYQPLHINSILFVLAIMGSIFFMISHHLWSLTLTYSFVLCVLNGTNPIIEKITASTPHKYGWIRIWGTIGYAVGFQGAGLLYKYVSHGAMYALFGFALVMTIIGLLGTASPDVPESNQETSGKTFFSRNFLLYLLIACFFYGITNVNHLYLPAMYQSEGLSVDLTSMIIFFSTLAEIPMLLFFTPVVNRWSNKSLLYFCSLGLILQLLFYVFCPIVFIQSIVTIVTKTVATIAFMLLNMKIVSTLVDDVHQMSALSFVAAMKSFSSIVFQFLSGYLIDLFSYHTFYLFLLIFSIIGLLPIIFSHFPSGKQVHLYH